LRHTTGEIAAADGWVFAVVGEGDVGQFTDLAPGSALTGESASPASASIPSLVFSQRMASLRDDPSLRAWTDR
jgi:hypothetical protein